MKINKDRLHVAGLTMMDIYMKLYEAYPNQMECVYSDDNAEELVLRIRLVSDKKKTKAGAAAGTGGPEGEEGGEAGTGDVPDEDDDAVAALKALEHNMVSHLVLKGIPGIKKVSMRSQERKEYSVATGRFHTLKEWILETDGSNLQELLCHPNVDATRVISNDVWEIYEAFGVEAARVALYNEIMDVIRESSVNYRHLSLLIDTMTHKGSLMSIDRHGINRGDVGPLAKSSFEETTDMLNNAGVFSDYDKINGVSANIMLGQLPPCGTGDSEILLDEAGYLEILQERRGKKAAKPKSAQPAQPALPEAPEPPEPAPVVIDPCDPQQFAITHKMPKKSKQKQTEMALPDAPF
jgi:DNA-directed RNA polymerase II subunit RPB1